MQVDRHLPTLTPAVCIKQFQQPVTQSDRQTDRQTDNITRENADCDTFPLGNIQSVCVYTCITFPGVDFHVDVI